MPPTTAPKDLNKSRFSIVGGWCHYPVAITVGAGITQIDIDSEISGQPLARTGAILGAVYGQGAGNRITYEVTSDNTIEFKGGGGGPSAVDIVAIIIFPAEEA